MVQLIPCIYIIEDGKVKISNIKPVKNMRDYTVFTQAKPEGEKYETKKRVPRRNRQQEV